MHDKDSRQEMAEAIQELYEERLITATGGNVSVRREVEGEAWITPSGMCKRELTRASLVRVGMDSKALDSWAKKPSSETMMHTAILRARPDVRAVVHCHAKYSTLLVNTGMEFLPISSEAAYFEKVGRIPFVMPGTPEMADAVAEALEDGWVVLMQNHGLVTVGATIRDAVNKATIIERTAELILTSYGMQKPMTTLPPEAVATIRSGKEMTV